MMRGLLARAARNLLVVPLVAIGSWYLMSLLPMRVEDESKRQIPTELMETYRRDLGLDSSFGFVRPWQKLFAGERLGTTAQGVTGDELVSKLGGSIAVGIVALSLALVWAVAWALFRVTVVERRWPSAGEVVPAIAFGTPVFIPALLLAPFLVEAGRFLPELGAALVLSLWPGVFLGTLMADGVREEVRREYVRTARGKGLSVGVALRRHVLPNVLPVLLDALPPVATAVLAGSFAAERVFGLPYFGQLYVVAVLQKQIAVVVVATTAFASLLVVVNLAVEILRSWVDPRAREGGAS
jgi:oligopeptide transport system permease protein